MFGIGEILSYVCGNHIFLMCHKNLGKIGTWNGKVLRTCLLLNFVCHQI